MGATVMRYEYTDEEWAALTGITTDDGEVTE